MAFNRREIEIAIRAALRDFENFQKVVKGVKDIGDAADASTLSADQLIREFEKLAAQQKLNERYKELVGTLRQSSLALREQRNDLATLNTAQSRAAAEVARLQSQFDAETANRNKLKETNRELREEIARVGQTLRQSGVSLRKAGEETSELAQWYVLLKEELVNVRTQQDLARIAQARTNDALRAAKKEASETSTAYRKHATAIESSAKSHAKLTSELKDIRQDFQEAGLSTLSYRRRLVELEQRANALSEALIRLTEAEQRAEAEFATPLPDTTVRARQGIDATRASFGRLFRTLTSYGGLSGILGVYGFLQLSRATVEAAASVERLERTLQTLESGGGLAAGELMEELVDQANRLGANMSKIGRPFVEFQLAVRDLNTTQTEASRLFSLYTESLLRAGGTVEELRDTQLGLVQSIRQGNIQYDEFRQIASRLPGAFAALSKALGVSRENLKDFIASGEAIFTRENLKVFIEELGKSVNATGEAIEGIDASTGRAGQALTLFGSTFFQVTGLADAYKSALEGIASVANGFSDSLNRQAKAGENAAAIITREYGLTADAIRNARIEAEKLEAALPKGKETRLAQLTEEGNQAFDALGDLEAEADNLRRAIAELESSRLSEVFGGTQSSLEIFRANLAGVILRMEDLRGELAALESEKAGLEFFGNSAGDLNTSRAAIIGLAEALKNLQSLPVDAPALKFLDQINESLNQLSLEQLEDVKTRLTEIADSATDFGVDVRALTALLGTLSQVMDQKATSSFGSYAKILDEAAAKNTELFEAQKATAEGFDKQSDAARRAAEASVSLARSQKEAADQAAAILQTEEARALASRRALELANAEAAAADETARALQTQAENEQALAEAREENIRVLRSNIAALQSIADAQGVDTKAVQAKVAAYEESIQALQQEAVAGRQRVEILRAEAAAANSAAFQAQSAAAARQDAFGQIVQAAEQAAAAEENYTRTIEDSVRTVEQSSQALVNRALAELALSQERLKTAEAEAKAAANTAARNQADLEVRRLSLEVQARELAVGEARTNALKAEFTVRENVRQLRVRELGLVQQQLAQLETQVVKGGELEEQQLAQLETLRARAETLKETVDAENASLEVLQLRIQASEEVTARTKVETGALREYEEALSSTAQAAKELAEQILQVARVGPVSDEARLDTVQKLGEALRAEREEREKIAETTGQQTAAQQAVTEAAEETESTLGGMQSAIAAAIDVSYSLSQALGDAVLQQNRLTEARRFESEQTAATRRELERANEVVRQNQQLMGGVLLQLDAWFDRVQSLRVEFFEQKLQVDQTTDAVRRMAETGVIDMGRLQAASALARNGLELLDDVQLDDLRSEIATVNQELVRLREEAEATAAALEKRLLQARGEDVKLAELEAAEELAALEEQLARAQAARDLEAAANLQQAIRDRKELLDIRLQELAAQRQIAAQQERQLAAQQAIQTADVLATQRELNGAASIDLAQYRQTVDRRLQIDLEAEERLSRTRLANIDLAGQRQLQVIERVEKARGRLSRTDFDPDELARILAPRLETLSLRRRRSVN